ncbi:MAG: N-acetyltransferase family protein [Bacteroidota bacterium]
MSTLTIRKANQNDAFLLPGVYNKYLGKATMDTTPRESDFFQEMIHKLGERETMLVAEINDDFAGYGILKKYSWKIGYQYTGEISIFLNGKFTGQGIGNKIMRQLIDQAKKWNYHHLVSRIMAINKGSISFHEKLGYEIVGFQKQAGNVEDKWHDIAILQLIID